MNSTFLLNTQASQKLSIMLCLLFFSSLSIGQMKPPGYEREMELYKAQLNTTQLERDSVTLIDTISVFDPETSESTTHIIVTIYSIKDYCKNFLAISNPDMLLDGKPHTVIDPRTYEDIVIRLNSSGKLDTIPQ